VRGPDEGFVRLKEIAEKEWPRLSEADTRSKIIDPLFVKCLGWDENDIIREEHNDSGYVDYIFQSNGQRLFVVEAKRNGVWFDIPKSFNTLNYKINASISGVKDLIKAMEQAHTYCSEIGMRFAVVTNGDQYVAFVAQNLTNPWREGKCIVFNGFQEMISSFTVLWNMLSKDSVLNGSFKRFLIDRPELVKFTRPLDIHHVGDPNLRRNDLYNRFLQPFSDYFFRDIVDESKINLLRECYVPQRSHTDAEDFLRNHFLARIKYLREHYNVQSFVESEDNAGEFGEAFDSFEKYLARSTPQGKLILLLGGVGAGKTTFLHRFFRVVLEPEDKLVWFYVDCKEAPIDAENIETFIFREMLEDFDRRYRVPLKDVIEKGGLSTLEPTYKDLVSLFAILRMHGYSTAMILDNVDQQQHVSVKLQEQTILEAERLSKALRTVQILSLREETFFRSSQRGVLDAYSVKRFNIPPPAFSNVVEKRLNYVIQLLESSEEKLEEVMKIEAPSESDRRRMASFLKIIRDNVGFRGPAHKGISNFITSISKGNMRLALDCFDDFLSSGNTKVDEMLGGYEATGSYTIPYHAFVKSVALADRRYFSGDASKLMNLFSMNTNYTNSHFLKLRILRYANENRQIESEAGRGMIDINSVKAEGERVGIGVNAIEDSLARLAYFKLIECEGGRSPDQAKFFGLTPTGEYYLVALVARFAYLDLVWQDTPIADDFLAHSLSYLMDERDVAVRLERVDKFIKYLSNQELLEYSQNPEYLDSALVGNVIFTDAIKIGYEKDREHILSRLGKGMEPEFFDDPALSEKPFWDEDEDVLTSPIEEDSGE
jgi:hypothetical protein